MDPKLNMEQMQMLKRRNINKDSEPGHMLNLYEERKYRTRQMRSASKQNIKLKVRNLALRNRIIKSPLLCIVLIISFSKILGYVKVNHSKPRCQDDPYRAGHFQVTLFPCFKTSRHVKPFM